jgi:hypothetical protein
MWRLAIHLELGNSRIEHRRRIIAVNDDTRKLFRSLSNDLENSSTVKKVIAAECQDVLDNVVRPTIRIAREEIKSSRVRVRENNLSILVVHEDGHGHDELVFECNGRELYSTAKVKGEQDSTTIAVNLDAVSEALVTKTIKTFLEQTLRPSRGQ